jgi:hypothetical protein
MNSRASRSIVPLKRGLCLVLFPIVFLATSPVDAHQASYASTVTLQRDVNRFKGNVGSRRKECKRTREVSVYRVRKGKKPVFIGADRTGPRGFYSIPAFSIKPGRFQARVTRAVKGGYSHTHTCRKDRSQATLVPG